MSYEKFKNWLHTSRYKQVIRTNANQDQMMLDAWNACMEMQSDEHVPTKELFSLYSAVNNLVAHIGMVGEITSNHDLVDAVMNSLYALDSGNVARRADDLIEKAFMPQSQALKLAVNEYIAKSR